MNPDSSDLRYIMEKILILDFGSQYTQLIARRVRELSVYCEIHPFNKIPALDASVRGVILSGSPFSVRDENAPTPDLSAIKGKLPLLGVCYGAQFLGDLAGVCDPETKRKIIGRDFVEVFNEEAVQIKDVRWLAQGTIYPDVIESVSVNGPSATIKSHHNVGGLPEKMNLRIVEPLRLLFKDEVRRVGRSLGISEQLIGRHPFPGPGLAIRILGDITPEKVEILQNVDKIYIDAMRDAGLYDKVWQAGAILLPVKSVGVMGDERTYESCVALRAVTSTDGMTADWVHLPYEFLANVSNDIINKVKGVNRVVYDISSKPPATIEWE